MNITTGKIKSPQKVVIYGPEGIGKSTFASKFPMPIFIDTEGSTKKLDVARFDRPTSFTMLLEQIEHVKKLKGQYKTLVIDTADWAEKLCCNQIVSKAKKNGIEDFGYGKGYTYLAEEFGKLLNLLEDIVNLGFNVVITAHAMMRKFEQPDESGSYDRWELKLEKKVAPLVKEWADTLLFANFKTIVVKVDDKKYKGVGGQERVMYTTHNACYDAKNRDNLPDVLPFDYSQIAHIIEDTNTPSEPKPIERITVKQSNSEIKETIQSLVDSAPDSAPKETSSLPDYIPKALADLMIANKVTEADIEKVVADKGYYPKGTSIANYDPEFINGCLVGAWEKVYSLILCNQDMPF